MEKVLKFCVCGSEQEPCVSSPSSPAVEIIALMAFNRSRASTKGLTQHGDDTDHVVALSSVFVEDSLRSTALAQPHCGDN